MKKNFCAAALVLATACVAFVGCKDYDSDIKNLQTQIDANKSAIEALEQAIAKGVTISGIDKKSDGYTIRFSDGSTVELANGKDGVAGNDVPVPQLRVNAAKNWEISTDGGTTWAELKDAAGNSIAEAKSYVADYIKIDADGYIVIGDQATSFKYDVTIPSVTEEIDSKIAIITVPATATEAMKTLRVPMEGYFDRLFVSNITPVNGHTTLAFTKITLQAGVTLGDKAYQAGDVVYTTAGMPVVINPAQVNAGAMAFTFVANTGAAAPETMPVTLSLAQGSDAAISQTKAAPATGLWTVSGTVTDDNFAGFEKVALSAENGNGTNTLSDYAFEIDVQAGTSVASGLPTAVNQNDGSAAVIPAATNIIDSYAAFDDGTQEKDGYVVRRADQSVPADAPYTGDWEVVAAPANAAMAMMTKAVAPTTQLTVVYTAVGLNGAKAEQNVTVDFFASIPAPAVEVVSVEGENVQNADASTATEISLTQEALLAALYPENAEAQAAWTELAKTFSVALDAPLAGEGSNAVEFELEMSGKGASVADAAAFDAVKITLDNPTDAAEYAATLTYEDQAGNQTQVKLSFSVASPVATVEGPVGKEIANTAGEDVTVSVAASDFTAKDGSDGTVSGGIVSVVSASSMDAEKMTVEVSGGNIVCTRVAAAAPEADETVAVTATVADKWGVEYTLTFDVKLAQAAI